MAIGAKKTTAPATRSEAQSGGTTNTGHPTNTPEPVTNSDYIAVTRENIYTFMSNAYDGIGGFRSGKYLVPHTTELRMFFERRQDLCFYKNFVKPILRAMVDPVFNSEIKRTVEVAGEPTGDGLLWHEFMEDCTRTGKTIQQFTMDAISAARLHGVTFVVMDNVREQPQAKIDAVEQGIYPYVSIRTAVEVDSWACDKTGKLVSITFRDADIKSDNGETEKRFSYWDNVRYVCYGEKSIVGSRGGKTTRYVVSEYNHGLGTLPVIAVFIADRKAVADIMPEPPLYDVAKINHAVFNKDSEIRDQERAQAFAVFYMQEDRPGNLSLGTHNYLGLPMSTTIAPGFASPDSSILAGLVSNMEKLQQALFVIAGQSGVNFRASAQVKSGDALEWEFQAQETVLKMTARMAEWLEYAMCDMFQLYTSESFDYTVEYPDTYGPNKDDKELTLIDTVLAMGMPDRPQTLLKKMAFQKAVKKEDAEVVADLLNDFDLSTPDSKVAGVELEPVAPVEPIEPDDAE